MVTVESPQLQFFDRGRCARVARWILDIFSRAPFLTVPLLRLRVRSWRLLNEFHFIFHAKWDNGCSSWTWFWRARRVQRLELLAVLVSWTFPRAVRTWKYGTFCRALDSSGDDFVYGRNAWFDRGYLFCVVLGWLLEEFLDFLRDWVDSVPQVEFWCHLRRLLGQRCMSRSVWIVREMGYVRGRLALSMLRVRCSWAVVQNC